MTVKKILKDWRIVIIFAPLILLLAIFLRTYSINSLPVFADEAIYVRWAQVMKAEATLRFLPLSDGKQPLFMWMTIPFLKLVKDPLVAGRTVSMVSGLVTMIGIFTLSYILFSKKKPALVSLFFYAISPFSVLFDRMALVDSLLSMFGIWTLIFGIITVRKLRLDAAMITGFALGGALITKSPAIFFALLLPSTIIFFEKKGKELPFNLLRVFFFWGVTLVISFAIFNVLRLGPNFGQITSRNYDYVFPISHIWENPRDPFLPHVDRSIEWLLTLGPGAAIATAIAGAVIAFQKHKRETFILLIWALVPILVQSEYAKVFTARYIFFSLPYIFILAGAIAIKKFNKRKYILPAIILIVGLHSLILSFKLITNPEDVKLPNSERSGYLEEWTSGTGIKEVSEFLVSEQAANPNQAIVVGTEGFFGTLPDGLQIYTQDKPGITVIGIGLGINGVPDSLKESKQFGNKTFLLVNSSRINFEGFKECYKELILGENPDCDLAAIFASEGVKVVKEYKKAERLVHYREYLSHGPYDTLYLFEVL